MVKTFTPLQEEIELVNKAIEDETLFPKEILEKYYLKENYSHKEIRLSFKIKSKKKVPYGIEKHGLRKSLEQRSRPRSAVKDITKEQLENLLHVEKLNLKTIAERYEVTYATIAKHAKRLGVALYSKEEKIARRRKTGTKELKRYRTLLFARIQKILNSKRIVKNRRPLSEATKEKISYSYALTLEANSSAKKSLPELEMENILKSLGITPTYNKSIEITTKAGKRRRRNVDFYFPLQVNIYLEVDGEIMHGKGARKLPNWEEIQERDYDKNYGIPMNGDIIVRVPDFQVSRENMERLIEVLKKESMPCFMRINKTGGIEKIICR